jgi:hypothetical protein
MLMGGTSLIIVVGVVLDTMSQVEALLKMHHQDGLVSKGKIQVAESLGFLRITSSIGTGIYAIVAVTLLIATHCEVP